MTTTYCVALDQYVIFAWLIYVFWGLFLVAEVALLYLRFLCACVVCCETENILNAFESKELLEHICRELSEVKRLTTAIDARLQTYDLAVAIYQPPLYPSER